MQSNHKIPIKTRVRTKYGDDRRETTEGGTPDKPDKPIDKKDQAS